MENDDDISNSRIRRFPEATELKEESISSNPFQNFKVLEDVASIADPNF